jgi:uncharacterized membrane protein YhaH (DUF805 family)
MERDLHVSRLRQIPEPQWPALVAVIVVGGLYLAVDPYLTIVPKWVLLVALCVLLVPTVISHRTVATI